MKASALQHSAGALLCVAALLSSCAVGPDYRSPDAPSSARYVAGPVPAAPGLPVFVDGAPVPARWWTLFGSPEIDALVQRALHESPTLSAARARVRQAQELLDARRGATTWPRANATAGATRQRVDPATFGFPEAPVPPPFNVFSLGANVSYDFDLFGAHTRELQALAAEVDFQRFEFEAAQLALAGNVVLSVIRLAALNRQIDGVAEQLALQHQQLQIAVQREALGAVSHVEVQQQRSQLAAAQAALPALNAQRELLVHLLSVLAGQAPALGSTPTITLAQIALPGELPLRLPSELVRQRPDIRANEALVQKASANVGVATADLYPKLVVSGAFSTSQLELSQLLGSGINVWSLGANLVQPLFRGGELRARQRAAEAAYDQSLASYRQAVLLGLQNVANVLRQIEADAHTVAQREVQAANAEEALRITHARFELGGVSRLAVLDVERSSKQAALDRSLAQASLLANAASLLQALGGGGVAEIAVGLR